MTGLFGCGAGGCFHTLPGVASLSLSVRRLSPRWSRGKRAAAGSGARIRQWEGNGSRRAGAPAAGGPLQVIADRRRRPESRPLPTAADRGNPAAGSSQRESGDRTLTIGSCDRILRWEKRNNSGESAANRRNPTLFNSRQHLTGSPGFRRDRQSDQTHSAPAPRPRAGLTLLYDGVAVLEMTGRLVARISSPPQIDQAGRYAGEPRCPHTSQLRIESNRNSVRQWVTVSGRQCLPDQKNSAGLTAESPAHSNSADSESEPYADIPTQIDQASPVKRSLALPDHVAAQTSSIRMAIG